MTMDTAMNENNSVHSAGQLQPAIPQPAGPKPAAEPAPVTSVDIMVRNKDNETFFKVKSTTSLGRIKSVWCERNGKDPRSVRFLFDGQRVQDGDTPKSLDLESGDAIDVFEEQTGGTDDSEILTITVHDSRDNDIAFKIKPSTPLGLVMDSYCKKHHMFTGQPPRRTVSFLFDGTPVLENDTAELLQLVDGDVIEVFQVQFGGGCSKTGLLLF